MLDEGLKQDITEKLLVIAYKRAVSNKDTAILTLLRQKYITVGIDSIFVGNSVITGYYFLGLNDELAFKFLRRTIMHNDFFTNSDIYGSLYA